MSLTGGFIADWQNRQHWDGMVAIATAVIKPTKRWPSPVREHTQKAYTNPHWLWWTLGGAISGPRWAIDSALVSSERAVEVYLHIYLHTFGVARPWRSRLGRGQSSTHLLAGGLAWERAPIPATAPISLAAAVQRSRRRSRISNLLNATRKIDLQ